MKLLVCFMAALLGMSLWANAAEQTITSFSAKWAANWSAKKLDAVTAL
jgi:hypothetical protein